MADATRAGIQALTERLDEVERYLHIDDRREEVRRLELESARPDFWNDADAASATMTRLTRAREDVAGIEQARAKLEDASAALDLADEMGEENNSRRADDDSHKRIDENFVRDFFALMNNRAEKKSYNADKHGNNQGFPK
jgi:hypothetical protein